MTEIRFRQECLVITVGAAPFRIILKELPHNAAALENV